MGSLAKMIFGIVRETKRVKIMRIVSSFLFDAWYCFTADDAARELL